MFVQVPHREAQVLDVTYTDHQGRRRTRRLRVFLTWYGESQWHEGAQWFIRGTDLAEPAAPPRDYAVSKMRDVHAASPGTVLLIVEDPRP